MASFGHIAVGLVGARLGGDERGPVARIAAFVALATYPDLDVLARLFGIPWRSPLAHRGALHSLPVALVVALVATLLLARERRARLRTAAVAIAVAASHGLLDALTTGGAGIALLWPFTPERVFAAWRPIPVAPIGTRLASARGVRVVTSEIALFAPLLVLALWPRQRPADGGDRNAPSAEASRD